MVQLTRQLARVASAIVSIVVIVITSYMLIFLNDYQKLLAARPKWHSSSDNLEHIMQRLESLERTAALTPGVTAAVAAAPAPPAPLMQRTPHSPPPPAAARVDGVHTSIIPRLTL